ncbi:unnamed protein product [Absidia cylindrospora]
MPSSEQINHNASTSSYSVCGLESVLHLPQIMVSRCQCVENHTIPIFGMVRAAITHQYDQHDDASINTSLQNHEQVQDLTISLIHVSEETTLCLVYTFL